MKIRNQARNFKSTILLIVNQCNTCTANSLRFEILWKKLVNVSFTFAKGHNYKNKQHQKTFEEIQFKTINK